jgi:cyanophycin synthetase
LEIREVVALAGPNIWTNRRALVALVDIGRFEEFPSNTLPGFADRLMAWLPSMVEHRCSVGERGGFFQRLVEGTYLGHVLEHVTLELQSLAAERVGFGRTRGTSERGVYHVVVEYSEEQLGQAALQTARALILAAVDGSPFDPQAEIAKLRDMADRICLGPGTRAIVEAAKERLIPFIRLNTGSLVQLGYGRAQRRIWTAETDDTSAVAEEIAQNKQLTRQLLAAVGLRVPEGRDVASPDDAWDAAQNIGLPVVVKPRDGNHGRGVSIDLHDAAEIRGAFELASREGSGVMVERMIPGTQHRVLVVKDRVVAVSRGEAERVTGDGIHSVRELVDKANQHPMRGINEQLPLSPLELDEIARELLNRQGFEPNSIPPQGKQVTLHYNGDFTTDVTDDLHPDLAEQCIMAARTVGLNIAGVDLIVERIDRPLNPQGGAIIEVNASPALLPHVKPLWGKARPVGAAIVSGLFQENETGRIPVIAVTGTNGKTSTVHLLDSILTCAGSTVGVATSDGVTIGGRPIAVGDCADAPSAKRVLMNPAVNAALFEISASSVANQGLAFDKCQIAVVTNLASGDHLGEKDMETLEILAKVKRVPVDVVLPEGTAVLNANDPAVVAFGAYCKGDVVYFGHSASDSAVRQLLNNDKRVVTVENGSAVLAQGARRQPVVPVSAIAHSFGGKLVFQVENALAAIGAAWSLGIDPHLIAQGVERAASTFPSRWACFRRPKGATIIVSMCRNAAALEGTISAIDALFSAGQRAAIYAVQPDHRPRDAFEQGLRLGKAFDKVEVVSQDDSANEKQERLVGELERGIVSGGRARQITYCASFARPETLVKSVENLASHQLLLVQARCAREFAIITGQLLDLGAVTYTLMSAQAETDS